MLPVVLFIAFWVLLGLGLFFIAIRGGLGGARQTLQSQSRQSRRVAGGLFVIIYVAFGVAIPILMLSGNRANASSQIGGIKLTPAEKRGRQLFGQNCGVCHTLAASNSVGKVGPNLDELKPPAVLTLNTINNGCLQTAGNNSPQACLGVGNMPASLLEGRDAQDVAAFVAKVAGKE